MTIEPIGRHNLPAAPPGWYPDPGIPGTRRYWSGAAWTEHVAMATVQVGGQVYVPPPTNHVLHLLLTLLTCGLWAPMWILIAWSNDSARSAAIGRSQAGR